ncbi:MAG: beta-lactamase family protein [Saprospiraceae bacterium]|jgi:CubicO group peptidase (beta-lactamase class C family)|nr:beta-lactamase family protein [Saprospiraceae bacterium]
MTKRRTFIKQAALGTVGIGIMGSFPACSPKIGKSVGQGSGPLPRSTPEAQGIPSSAIRNFLAAVEKSGQEFHGFMVVRHGHVVAEGWWSPFAPALKHTLYSLSKSFTSTAIGMCVADGKMSVEDPVTKFFPNDLPNPVPPRLAAMKVKHLLTMNNGHDGKPMEAMQAEPNGRWAKAYLAEPIPYEPGTHFFYNTGSTYMLSAIVQKLTGKTTFDFLGERLFKPLGIEGADWEISPEGVSVGGYGLRTRLEDIAKFGQLYLQNGKWGGQQIIPASWVEEATKRQGPSQDNDSDWGQGYGYQFWRCKPEPGFYRGDGAFGQYCIVIPQYDTVIAINSESKDMGASMKLAWDHLLPALKNDSPLPEDAASQKALAEKLENIGLSIPSLQSSSPLAARLSGKEFKLENNEKGLASIRFAFEKDSCKVMVQGKTGTQTLTCGFGHWHTDGNEQDVSVSLFALPERVKLTSKTAASATWQDDQTLLINLKFIENVHGDQWICRFDGNKLTVSFKNSLVMMGKEEEKRAGLVGFR